MSAKQTGTELGLDLAANPELEQLRRERDYYRRHADELAAQSVKQDFTISSLQHGLTQKTRGLALLSALQQNIGATASHELSEIFLQVTQGISATLGMNKVIALTPGSEAGSFVPEHWAGFHSGTSFPGVQLRPGASWLARPQSLLVNRAAAPSELSAFIKAYFSLPYFILMPVVVSGAPVALFLAGRDVEQRPFAPPLDDGDADTLRAIAVLVAANVQQRQMTALKEDNEALRRMAIIDKLTGIYNRRHFEDLIAQEWRRAGRKGGALSVFLLDVDHFKNWNDTLGHAMGDIVLEQVARVMTQSLRPADVGARYGGEEFVVMLPETDIEGACIVAERVRQGIECSIMPRLQTDGAIQPLPYPGDEAAGSVTVSIGVASAIPAEGAQVTHLLHAADTALYAAKREGRNRVVAAR